MLSSVTRSTYELVGSFEEYQIEEKLLAVIETINQTLAENFQPLTLVVTGILLAQIPWLMRQNFLSWDSKRINLTVATYTQNTFFIGNYFAKPYLQKTVNKNLVLARQKLEKLKKEYKLVTDKMADEPLTSAAVPLQRFQQLNTLFKATITSGSFYPDDDKAMKKFMRYIRKETDFMDGAFAPALCMEEEAIAICSDLLNSQNATTGIVTSGSAQSTLEACKAYVLFARENKISHPEIIVPSSAHPDFEIAAKILNAKLICVDVDLETGKANVAAMKKKINRNTCMLVGSAPSFAFGVIDPIEELAALAVKENIHLHVDSCFGGFHKIFAFHADCILPKSDFSIPGVNSIAMDTTTRQSILIFKKDSKPNLEHLVADSTLGVYHAKCQDTSRSAADIVSVWITLNIKSKIEFTQQIKDVLELRKNIIEKISAGLPEVEFPYTQDFSIIGMKLRDDMDPSRIVSILKAGGLTLTEVKGGLHFFLTPVHTRIQHAKHLPEVFVELLGKAIRQVKDENQKAQSRLPAAIALEGKSELPSGIEPQYCPQITDYFGQANRM